MIDIHMHIGRLYFEPPLEPEYLLDFMDKNNIEKAVLLPIENPEDTSYYVTTEYVLEICKKYPDRFIPFCNVDPRRRKVPNVIKEYKERGCVGFGEMLCGLYVDDVRMQKIYEVCGELKMPIIFDLSGTTCLDEVGLPKFEQMIKKFPETLFIGHGPHFWAEISSDIKKEEFSSYPKGEIKNEGAVIKLLSNYSNSFADLSAGSGYNAITRDINFGYKFLEKFQNKLFFGTDICHVNQDVPIIQYIKKAHEDKKITQSVYEKITEKNIKKILNL